MLNNTLYQTIMRSYDSRLDEERRSMEARVAEVRDKIPGYRDTDMTLISLHAKAARARIQNASDSDLLASINSEIKTLTEKKTNLLKTSGYPEDYTKIRYNCPICRDTGYDGDNFCSCFKQAAVKAISRMSNLSDQILSHDNFDTFRLDYYSDVKDTYYGISPRENMSDIIERTRNYIRHFSDRYVNFLFMGATGTGKSFLSHCIADQIIKAQHTVLYLSAAEMIESFESHVFDREEASISSEYGEDAVYDALFDCELLIIDDLGTETANSFTVPRIFNLLDTRDRLKRSTIITTNLNLAAIQDRYTERICSRITSYYEIYPLFGEDIRMKLR